VMSALRGPLELLTSPDRLSGGASASGAAAGGGASGAAAAGSGGASGGLGGGSISDKAEVAAAAEALAGLIASGAPWADLDGGGEGGGGGGNGDGSGGGGGGGGWAVAALRRALRGSSMETCECWALAYRFAIRGLLDGLFPDRLRPVMPPDSNEMPWDQRTTAPPPPPPPRPVLAGGLTAEVTAAALGDLLGLTVPLAATAAKPGSGTTGDTAEVAAAMAAATVGDGGGGGGDVESVIVPGGGGLPAQLKRLRCVAAAVRELSGVQLRGEEEAGAKEEGLPLQVRLFWCGLLRELRQLASCPDSASAEECLSLREQLGQPLLDALSYFGATEGLLTDMGNGNGSNGDPTNGGNGGRRRTATEGRRNGGNGGGGNGSSGSNGEGELVHVSAEPSGMSTPAEMELGEGEEEPVLILHPANATHRRPGAGAGGGGGGALPYASMSYLRSAARSLAADLVRDFNAAAVRVQAAARGEEEE
ncbi:hypothetical protein Agub_g5594, partial [Astrephomene gubernaculifera]